MTFEVFDDPPVIIPQECPIPSAASISAAPSPRLFPLAFSILMVLLWICLPRGVTRTPQAKRKGVAARKSTRMRQATHHISGSCCKFCQAA